MMTLLKLVVFASISLVAQAAHCLEGLPVMLGPQSKDGDTKVTVWAQSPFPANYLIGGWSNSIDFTESTECSTNGFGCAFMANWSTESETFTQRWIWKASSGVREIVFQPDANAEDASYFAVVMDVPVVDNSNLV